MIRKIGVRNFLSLKKVDLELGLRNVFVGPNMSGKSNLIDCLKFLATVSTPGLGIAKAMLDRGGFQEVIWKGGSDSRFKISLVVDIPTKESKHPTSYDYNISILGGATNQYSIESEELYSFDGDQRRTILQLSDSKGQFDNGSGPARAQLPTDHSALEWMHAPGHPGQLFVDFVSSWRFYALLPSLMRKSNPPGLDKFLMEHGDNFSTWLLNLQTNSVEFRQFKQAALDVFPDLTEILMQPTQFGTMSISTSEKHLKGPVGIAHMSDGELVFLALLSLIYAPPELGARVYCIEEPESYLHPTLLETLIELLTQRQAELGDHAAQIIATTHSPLLVDRLSIEDLIVVEKTDGQTKCTRPSSNKHLRELVSRKDAGLGDLWYSGALNDLE
jgi:predicted ATPase